MDRNSPKWLRQLTANVVQVTVRLFRATRPFIRGFPREIGHLDKELVKKCHQVDAQSNKSVRSKFLVWAINGNA